MVTGCKQPNLEPIALRLKKTLLPALQHSDVLVKEDGETEHNPNQSMSGKLKSPTKVHLLKVRLQRSSDKTVDQEMKNFSRLVVV